MLFLGEEVEDIVGGFEGFFVIVKMTGAGDKNKLGLERFGEGDSAAFADEPVAVAGKKQDVLAQRKIGNGGVSREIGCTGHGAAARRLIGAAEIGGTESLAEERAVMRDEKKASGNVIDDATRRDGREWRDQSKRLAGLGGNWRHEDELMMDFVGIVGGGGGGND